MKITVNEKLDSNHELIVLAAYEEDLDLYKTKFKFLHEELQVAKKKKQFSGKQGEAYTTKDSGKHYYVAGLGKKAELTTEKVRKALGRAVKYAKAKQIISFSTNVAQVAAMVNSDDELLGRAVAEALVLADYSFVKYLAKERQDKKLPLSMVQVQWSKDPKKLGSGLTTGRIIAESANFVRDLVEEPAGVASSIFMEKAAKSVAAKNSKIKMKVLGEAELKKLGMNIMLGVNAGSKNPPKLIIVQYAGGKSTEKYTALVGKGITFDSGGYNLKPTKYIEDMKTDMGGSAAALGTLRAVAELGIKKNVMAVMGMCENMVSSKAQHPGDIVKGYKGKTVEIGNTDAEGRLVLADALAYIEDKYQPEVMIDLATLTGACVVALGYYTAAVMGREKDQDLIDAIKKAGMSSGDRAWQLPFFDEYQDWMNGSISDLNNISQKGKGYEGGSITAGVFLSNFVEKTKWAHLDIAGSAYWAVDGDYLQKGATGSGVRMLAYWLLDQ